MKLEELPNEVFFRVLLLLDYTNLLSLLKISVLRPRLQQFVRLVQNPYDIDFQPFKEFAQFVQCIPIPEELESYTIYLFPYTPTDYEAYQYSKYAMKKHSKTFIIAPRAESDEVVERPRSNIHDRMNIAMVDPEIMALYRYMLLPGATLVTAQRAVSFSGHIQPYCTITGPELKVLRLAGVQTASSLFFEGQKVSTLILCACSLDVLTTALLQVEHNKSITTLDVIGIPRKSFGRFKFKLEKSTRRLGTVMAGFTFDNLTKVSLRMMRVLKDVTFLKAKELYITLIADRGVGDTAEFMISGMYNVSGPEVTHLGLCFFTKLPLTGDLDFPKCQHLTASFELERDMYTFAFGNDDSLKFDPTTYVLGLDLPYPKRTTLQGCIQFTNPTGFGEVEHLTIRDKEPTYTPLDNQVMRPVISAPKLQTLIIKSAKNSHLPTRMLKAPLLKELVVHTAEDYQYCYPRFIHQQFPNLEILEIHPVHVQLPAVAGPMDMDFEGVVFPKVHMFTCENLSVDTLTNWMKTFKDNTLTNVRIKWATASKERNPLPERFWIELARQKKSLMELSICLGSYSYFIQVPQMKPHYLQGFEKLIILSVAGAHNLFVQDCPELVMIRVNAERETKGLPRLCIDSIQLANLPKLDRVLYRVNRLRDPHTGKELTFQDFTHEKVIIKIGPGVPESVLLVNVYDFFNEFMDRQTELRFLTYELRMLARCRLPHDRSLILKRIKQLRKECAVNSLKGEYIEHEDGYSIFVRSPEPDVGLDSDEWSEHTGDYEDIDSEDESLADFEDPEDLGGHDQLDLFRLAENETDESESESDFFDEIDSDDDEGLSDADE